jgi:hypothetical protein
MTIPLNPYIIETSVRHGDKLVKETRNAGNLPQAVDIAEKERRKARTRSVRLLCILWEMQGFQHEPG